MLQLNLLLPATPDGTRVPATANLAGNGLLAELFDPETGEPTAFAAELHALLMALSPQQVDRLRGLIQGGMSLPQAASAILAGQQGGPPLPGLMPGPDGLPAAAGDDPSAPAMSGRLAAENLGRQPMAALLEMLGGGEQAELRPGMGPASVPLAQGGLSALLSGPLGNNLLAMGVPQRVGSAEWADAVSDRVFWMAQGGQQFARLQLNPPNLGPLEVRLNLSQDQASVSFIAGQAAVREALEAALPRLREMFDQQSIVLVRAEVRDPGSGSGQQAGDAERGGGGRGADGNLDPGLQADPPALPAARVSDRLVDLFA